MNPLPTHKPSEPPVGDDGNAPNPVQVTTAAGDPFGKLSVRRRLAAAFGALVLLVPLVIACLLEPDAKGYGTHQQLGFPPCTLVALCGIRCPTCGMTTAWANVVRGRLLDGLAANVGGVLLALAAIGSVIGLSATAVFGRRPRWFPGVNGFAWYGMAIAAVTLVDWAIRISLL